MRGINDFTYEELEHIIVNKGLPKFRAGQIYDWLGRGVQGFDEMTNLPKNMRDTLLQEFIIKTAVIEKRFQSALDQTVKYLIKLQDNKLVEAVAMQYKHGTTICLSTQVGCRMGCGFCASTLGGLERNLTAGEMTAQIYAVQKDLGQRISNIVLMGIGEPLDNYDNVIRFLKNVNHPSGLNIGYRHISLSTCGLVDRINDLANEGMPITLSISLHAPDDETRAKIMPINKKYPVEKLISACKDYIKKTNRRISFEYILIDKINDSDAHAEMLSKLVRGILCHVNLIPVNYVEECGMKKSPPERIRTFQKLLADKGINVTVRRELGKDINASCGQLRKANS